EPVSLGTFSSPLGSNVLAPEPAPLFSAPGSVTAQGGTANLPIRVGTVRGAHTLRVVLHAAQGTFQVQNLGRHVRRDRPPTLTVTGSTALINRTLHSLQLKAGPGRTQVTLSIVGGGMTQKGAIQVRT